MEAGEGENAVSTGPMVPVLASNDEGRSRAILTLLEAHGIPALLDADLQGAFVGFHDPVPSGWSQVLVPTSMRAEALRVLREHEGESDRRGPPPMAFSIPVRNTDAEFSSVVPTSDELAALQQHIGLPDVAPVHGLAPGDLDDEEEPVDLLTENGSTQQRATLALGAIAFGVTLQRLLSFWVGPEAVLQRLAARAPILDEPYRLVTASFIHGGPGHLFSNALFGLIFGVVLFGTHGAGAAAFVWLVSSAGGMLAELALSPEALVIGASAGNYGLVGLWLRGQLERACLAPLPRRERLKTIGFLILLIPGALTPFSSSGSRIAVLAHVVGFFVGYGLGFVFNRRLLTDDFETIEERSRLAGLYAVVVVMVAWVIGVAGFLPI